jgi:DNA-binding MarR family transcriptional regulator
MSDQVVAERLKSLSSALKVLRRGIDEMPTSWILIILGIAERPGCTSSWLAENAGLSISVVNRVLQELGPNSDRSSDVGLVDSAVDPINSNRKIWLLTENGRARINEMLSAAFEPDLTYSNATISTYWDAFAPNEACPHVRSDHFNQSQLKRIKAAASKRFSNFKGANLVALPLKPAEALIEQQHGADGESYDGLSSWVKSNRGRWFEMPSIYPADGGVALADFDDPNDAFHFILRWRGSHER